MSLGDSFAFLASSERGNARKVIPKALTKQAAAKALVNAKTASEAIKSISKAGFPKNADWKNA